MIDMTAGFTDWTRFCLLRRRGLLRRPAPSSRTAPVPARPFLGGSGVLVSVGISFSIIILAISIRHNLHQLALQQAFDFHIEADFDDERERRQESCLRRPPSSLATTTGERNIDFSGSIMFAMAVAAEPIIWFMTSLIALRWISFRTILSLST